MVYELNKTIVRISFDKFVYKIYHIRQSSTKIVRQPDNGNFIQKCFGIVYILIKKCHIQLYTIIELAILP